MRISLIISTYNNARRLDLCLQSVARQKVMPDEIVIADDGSSDDTANVIDEWRKRISVPLIHVWQEDNGFRLAAARNKAMATATGDYLVQIDGDILLSPSFIADHRRLARKGSYCKGTRVRLDRERTDKIMATGTAPSFHWWSSGQINRGKAFRILPLAYLFAAFFKKDRATAKGCNMSFWRDDIVRVNGYDETFEGWGREDDDLAHRLFRSGVKMRELRFAALCRHLWHEENSRDSFDDNADYCRRQDESGVIRCVKGLEGALERQ